VHHGLDIYLGLMQLQKFALQLPKQVQVKEKRGSHLYSDSPAPQPVARHRQIAEQEILVMEAK
jgi:hypothetical protein